MKNPATPEYHGSVFPLAEGVGVMAHLPYRELHSLLACTRHVLDYLDPAFPRHADILRVHIMLRAHVQKHVSYTLGSAAEGQILANMQADSARVQADFKPRLTPTQKFAVCVRVNAGESTYKIAKDFGISEIGVRHYKGRDPEQYRKQFDKA